MNITDKMLEEQDKAMAQLRSKARADMRNSSSRRAFWLSVALSAAMAGAGVVLAYAHRVAQ